MSAPSVAFAIEAIEFFERPVRLRLPFRFGIVTLREAPQAFVRVRVCLPRNVRATGAAAEMLMPKWFDKNPALSNDDNLNQLRGSLVAARAAYLSDRRADSAFGFHARHYAALLGDAGYRGINPLVASYGPALIDRALMDALTRGLNLSFYQAMRANLVGFEAARLAPDFSGFDNDAFLAGLSPQTSLAARHTVGLADPITAADPGFSRIGDGLPQTLEEVIAAYGHRYFKIKVAGDVATDIERMKQVASVLDAQAGDYRVTLDGNEQYSDASSLRDLWHAVCSQPRLSRFRGGTLFIEQPIARQNALSVPLPVLDVPVIIDESDGDLGAFPAARALGYRGVSSKSCKGLYKSLVNLARTRAWNRTAGAGHYFMSAEDLTMQAGVAVQQDLALVSLLGVGHVERNGHHYVDGMAGIAELEQQAFLDAHPGLYERSDGAVRLGIHDGLLHIGTLACAGFATSIHPLWDTMTPMQAVDVQDTSGNTGRSADARARPPGDRPIHAQDTQQ